MADTEQPIDKAAGRLAGGFATFSAVLAGAGAVGGGLERMIRNNPEDTLWAFLLVVVSILLALLALSWFPGPSADRVRAGLVLASYVAFAAGLLIGAVAATQTPQLRERPRVTSTLKPANDGYVLHSTLRANGLRATDHFAVLVTAFKDKSDTEGPLIYWSRTGPDREGAVDIELEVPVPKGYEVVAVEGNTYRLFSEGLAPTPRCAPDIVSSGCSVLEVPVAKKADGRAAKRS